MQETKQEEHIWGHNWNYQFFHGISEAWDTLVYDVVSYGEIIKPRGQATKEITNVSITYPGANRQYTFYNPVRNLNPVYHLVELYYYLSGRNDGLRGEYIKNAEDYVNLDTNRHDGSYGPAFYYGLPY